MQVKAHKYALFLLFLSSNIQVLCLIICKCRRLLIVYFAKGAVFRQNYT